MSSRTQDVSIFTEINGYECAEESIPSSLATLNRGYLPTLGANYFYNPTSGLWKPGTLTDDNKINVEANITGGTFQLRPYVPYTSFNSSGVSINSTEWTNLLSITGTPGKIGFIACAASTSNYRVRLTIDTLVVFNLAMSDLNFIGLSNAVNVAIWAETALKNFRYHPRTEADFTDSVSVDAMTTTGTDTLTYLISYREDSGV